VREIRRQSLLLNKIEEFGVMWVFCCFTREMIEMELMASIFLKWSNERMRFCLHAMKGFENSGLVTHYKWVRCWFHMSLILSGKMTHMRVGGRDHEGEGE
jgi:hypothetical protein